MQSLTGSLQVIGTQITASRQIQEQKDQQEADLENRLAQQKLREGKESVIEKKDTSSSTCTRTETWQVKHNLHLEDFKIFYLCFWWVVVKQRC